ncbi:type 1 fimbrial protein [Pseudomonas guariconensis]|uniref:fimbrial protein n=2 Tax=Pseudomonas TaxID=286 RepID=UPI00209A8C23|nr:fimbrial protein [Pseudomonas guariconensis]MCO7605237.1 type 1 fimbrial protein [Pseudomonas guariconensis]
MKSSYRHRHRAFGLALCALPCWLLSTSVQAYCRFHPGPTYMTFERAMGTLWVPRDAPIGSVIGSPQDMYTGNKEGAVLNCFYMPDDPPTANLPNTAPIFPGTLPPINGKDVNGHVMQTNVPGVGVYIDLGYPYNDSADNNFTPDDGSTAIPYTGTMRRNTGFNMPLSAMYGEALFIKIGDIPPGPQFVSGEIFHGFIHHFGKVMEYHLSATVHQAQCSLKADAVSADPVLLGDYKLDDFKGVGTTTPAVPFHITLSDCQDASAPNPQPARVHIELDGVKGSTPTVPAEGRFSLTGSSDAAGIEIQLLRSDGTPMPLGTKVNVKPVEIGVTRLDFQARYYQSASKVTPGLAEGALSFTVSYE